MLRFLLFVMAMLAAGASAVQAAGTVYRDPAGRFEVEVPEGWEAKPPADGRAAFAMRSLTGEETNGACAISVRVVADFRGLTQAQLDAVLEKVFTAEFWQRLYRSPQVKDSVIEGWGTLEHKGRRAYYGIASTTVMSDKGDVRVKVKGVFHGIPGSLHAVSCTSKAEMYATLEPAFEGVFASYEAKSGLSAAVPPVASTTLLNVQQLSFEGLASLMLREQVKDAAERAIGPAKGAQLKAVSERIAAGTVYRDPLGRFSVTVPEGWQTIMGSDDSGALGITSPRVAETFGGCGFSWIRVQYSRNMTQAQIDAEMDQTFTPAFWSAAFNTKDAKDVVMEATGTTINKGRKTYFAVVVATVNLGNGEHRMKFKQVAQAIPGSSHVLTCLSKAEFFPAHEADFESVIASYDPKSGEIIASAPTPSSTAKPLMSAPGSKGGYAVGMESVKAAAALVGAGK